MKKFTLTWFRRTEYFVAPLRESSLYALVEIRRLRKTSNQEHEIALGRCLQLLTDEIDDLVHNWVKNGLHVLDADLQIVSAEEKQYLGTDQLEGALDREIIPFMTVHLTARY